MPTAIHRFVAAAQSGVNPRDGCRMQSGWVVMGEVQVLPGYCLLLPDPVVPHLNALAGQYRAQFLEDLTAIGDALLGLTSAVRINYEVLGNLEPALHGHVIPRYQNEPDELRTKPIWFHDWEAAPKFDLSRDHQLMIDLAKRLN